MGQGIKTYKFWGNFQRAEGGGMVIFKLKFMLQILDLSIGLFRTFSEKNCYIIFRKGGGGVKGRLEFFQKFIRFGTATCPLYPKIVFTTLYQSYSFAI